MPSRSRIPKGSGLCRAIVVHIRKDPKQSTKPALETSATSVQPTFESVDFDVTPETARVLE